MRSAEGRKLRPLWLVATIESWMAARQAVRRDHAVSLAIRICL